VAGVVITGLGAVSALGPDVQSLRAGLRAGRDGIGPLMLFEYRGRSTVAAEAPDVTAEWPLPAATVRRLSRPDRFALVAAGEAIAAAGLDRRTLRSTAVVVGATTGGMFETESSYRDWRAGAASTLRTSRVLGTSLATSGAAVAQAFGAYGPQETASTACSSSALAIARAAEMIETGRAAVAVALGTDGLCRLTYAGFDALQALDPERCRPFDRERRGLTLGEGAGALVLEDAAHARARGVRIVARLLGWGTATDAHHPTAPHPEGRGAVVALRDALAMARLAPRDVDYVNAHGTGTPQNDAVEAAVLRAIFGDELARIPVSSTKSQIGHTLGAAGALEAVVTAIALADAVLPPTLGLREADPSWAGVDLVTAPGRAAALRAAVSSSYGFGGHNVTLALGRSEPA